MPGRTGSDGSITIDTKLDNTGFERGSDRLRHAVQSLTNQVNATGGQLKNSFKFDFGQPKQAVNSFSGAIKQANSEITGLGDLAKQALTGDVDALEMFQQKTLSIYDQLQEMRAELDKFGGTLFETAEHAKLAAGFEKASLQVEMLSASLEQAEEKFEILTNEFGRTDEYMNLEDRIDELRLWKEEYDAATRAGDSGGQLRAMMGAGVTNGSIEDALKAAQAEMDKMWTTFENSSPYKSTQREIDKITDKLGTAKEEAARLKAEMDAVPAGVKGSDTQAYAQSQSILEATEERLQAVQDAFYNTGSAAETSSTGVATLEERLQRIPSLGSLIRGTLGSALHALADGAKKATASLIGMISSRITGAFKKLGNSIAQVGHHSKGMNVSLKGGFMTILKYGLGIRSLYFLFRKLRSALMAGITDLSQYDSTLKTNIANFKTALTTLRNSFASAFAPVVNLVLPILTNLINTISTAISRIGMLIAALTGQKTYMMATSNAADSAADSTNAANKAAKDYKKTLAGFDDIEILEDNSDSGAGGGAGSGAGGGGFQEVPIEGGFGDLAQMIKDAWANADFTEIGRMVGEKLKSALDAIPWGDIKDVLRRIAKSIATFLNGFLETPGLFSKIGYTIAQAINSAFEFVESFVSNFHWSSLGTAIRDLIVGALDNLDWPLIEKTASELGVGLGNLINSALNDPKIWSLAFTTLARAINTLFTLAKNFMLTVEWESIGKNAAEGIKDGIGKINWLSWGVTIALFVNSIFRLLKGFFENFPWEDLGNGIVEAIRGFFLEFNWKDAGAALYAFLHGLLTTLRTVLQRMPWKSIPFYITDAIKKFLEGFDWQGLIDGTIGLIQDALDALIQLISGSSKKGEKSPVVVALEKLKETVGKLDAKAFEDLATAIGDLVTGLSPAVEGFAAGFLEVMNGLFKIGIGFFKALGPALQAIADAINSIPPDVLEDIGKHLGVIAGALITIKSAQGVLTFFSSLAGGLGGIGAAGKTAAEGAAAAAAGAEAAGGAASGATGGILGFFGSLVGNLGVTTLVTEQLGDLVQGYDDTHFASKDAQTGMQGVYDALDGTGKIAPQYREEMSAAAAQLVTFGQTGEGFEEAFWGVADVLEKGGGNVDTFKSNLRKMLTEGVFNEEQAKVIQSYLGDIGTSASNADTDTISLQDTFDMFKSLSITTPLKLALLSGAIDAISKSGKLSKEDTAALYKTLDDYKAEPTEANLNKVETALDNAGVSAGDFNLAFIGAVQGLDPALKAEYVKVMAEINKNNASLKTGGKTGGENFANGLINGIESKEEDVKTTIGTVADDDLIGNFDEKLHMQSPSRVMYTRGQYIMEGLRQGIQNKRTELVTLINDIIRDMNTKIISYLNTYRASGTSLMQNVKTGVQSMKHSLGQLAGDISDYMQDAFDDTRAWRILGNNAAVGIYNGFVALNGKLQQLAYNVASNMLAAAERALDIGSPSKEFAWIGEMTVAGLVEGIESSEGSALNSVSSLAQAITEEASGAHPIAQIETGIDAVLTTFSDKITSGFTNLISTLEAIAGSATFSAPAMANGSVLPYSARRANVQDQADNLSTLANALAMRDSGRLTREDLIEVFTELFREYMNFDFRIGDEQIARHANAGNAKLVRRYGAT